MPFRGKLTNVTKEILDAYPSLSDFLNFNGFSSVYDAYSGKYNIKPNARSAGPPVFYLDDVLINQADILLRRSMYDFEDVYVDTSPYANNLGVSTGGFGFVSIIKLYTRRTTLFEYSQLRFMQNYYKLRYGFETKKKFYTPKITSYQNQSFKDLGVIHWEPNITLTKDSNFNIKTIDTGLKEISFYIEGMSNDGKLISQVIKINK